MFCLLTLAKVQKVNVALLVI